MQDETHAPVPAEAETAATVTHWGQVLDACHGTAAERQRCGDGVRILTVGMPPPVGSTVNGNLTVRHPSGLSPGAVVTDDNGPWFAAWGDWRMFLRGHLQEWSAPQADWHACRGLSNGDWHEDRDAILREYIRASGQLVAVVAVVGPPPPSSSPAWEVLRSYTGHGVHLVVGPDWAGHAKTPDTAIVAVPHLAYDGDIDPGYLVRDTTNGYRFGVLVKAGSPAEERRDAVLRLAGLTAGALVTLGEGRGPGYFSSAFVDAELRASANRNRREVLRLTDTADPLPFPHAAGPVEPPPEDAAPLGARARRLNHIYRAAAGPIPEGPIEFVRETA
jgi:hypothetical protein